MTEQLINLSQNDDASILLQIYKGSRLYLDAKVDSADVYNIPCAAGYTVDGVDHCIENCSTIRAVLKNIVVEAFSLFKHHDKVQLVIVKDIDTNNVIHLDVLNPLEIRLSGNNVSIYSFTKGDILKHIPAGIKW